MIVSELKKSIKDLSLKDKIVNKLENLNIITVEDLWKAKKSFLKEQGVKDQEICDIKVKLQLLSLDLNGKVYNKN